MPSGKFIVRLSPESHTRLKNAARTRGRSLNDLCVSRLSLPSPHESLPPELATAVSDIVAIAENDLLGIVAFGSWARQDTSDLSDIDILVVLQPAAAVNRDLYRRWEKVAPAGTRVEPHFVALPKLNERISGLWAEVSIDGLVMVDPDLMVQRHLQHVRQYIAAGRLVAKRVHGQNYWIHVEVA